MSAKKTQTPPAEAPVRAATKSAKRAVPSFTGRYEAVFRDGDASPPFAAANRKDATRKFMLASRIKSDTGRVAPFRIRVAR